MAGFKINKRDIEKVQRDIAKEFERAARRNPVRVPVQVDTPEIPSALPANVGIEKDPHLSRLLMWLDDLAALQPGVWPATRCPAFRQGAFRDSLRRGPQSADADEDGVAGRGLMPGSKWARR